MVRVMHDLIEFPKREEKPRKRGTSMVLDDAAFGVHRPEIMAYKDFIDLVKCVIPCMWIEEDILKRNIQAYRAHGIDVQLGGVPYEIAVLQGKQEQYIDRVLELGTNVIEVENHAADLSVDEMKREIRRLKQRGVVVVGEVGAKWVDYDDTRKSNRAVDEDAVVRKVSELIDAGADHVYWEGMVIRALIGNKLENKEGQEQLLRIMERVDRDKIVLEVWSARGNQNLPIWGWLVHHFGPDVNLANVPINEIAYLESVRRGCIYDPGHPYLRWLSRGRPTKNWWEIESPDYRTDLAG